VCLNLTVFKLGPAGGGRKGTLYLLLKAAGLMGVRTRRARTKVVVEPLEGGDTSHRLSNVQTVVSPLPLYWQARWQAVS
jgi:hypothetical protein